MYVSSMKGYHFTGYLNYLKHHTKQLSALLTSCFKTIITHFKQYCNGIYKHTGVNCFWIINNSKEVLDRLQNINKKF